MAGDSDLDPAKEGEKEGKGGKGGDGKREGTGASSAAEEMAVARKQAEQEEDYLMCEFKVTSPPSPPLAHRSPNAVQCFLGRHHRAATVPPSSMTTVPSLAGPVWWCPFGHLGIVTRDFGGRLVGLL